METTSLVPEDRRDEGHRSSQTSEDSFLSSSVGRAHGSSCPNCKGYYVVSASTGLAFEMSCKSWSCPICSRKRRAVGVELIAGGVERARRRGKRIRFVTLTAPPSGMSMSELYCSWNRVTDIRTVRGTGDRSAVAWDAAALAPNCDRQRPVRDSWRRLGRIGAPEQVAVEPAWIP
jgi:hypothetical protein